MQTLANPLRDRLLSLPPWSQALIDGAAGVDDWLRLVPDHRPTPLRRWRPWGDDGPTLWLKNETQRMGAGSFKALGGAYAVARLALAAVQRAAPGLGLADLMAAQGHAALAGLEVCCASAGNHGLSVAAGARAFGLRCSVFVSRHVPQAFVDRLEAHGARVLRAGDDYEQSMAAAAEHAAHHGATLVSDSSWPGYTEVPLDIMRGYVVIAREAHDEAARGGFGFSHVFVQAGVGGLAAAIAAGTRLREGEGEGKREREGEGRAARLVVVEPDAADCLRASALAGGLRTVAGPASNMGRLDCKTPSMIAFELLAPACDDWVTVSDDEAAAAEARLRPLVPTTPSGAAGVAAAWLGWTDAAQRAALGLTAQSQVLCFVTEVAT